MKTEFYKPLEIEYYRAAAAAFLNPIIAIEISHYRDERQKSQCYIALNQRDAHTYKTSNLTTISTARYASTHAQ